MIVHASAKSEVRCAEHTFHIESAAEGGARGQLRTPPRGCSGELSAPAMPSRVQNEVRGDDRTYCQDTRGRSAELITPAAPSRPRNGVRRDNRARRRYAAGSAEMSASSALCRPRFTRRAPRGRRSTGTRIMKDSKTDTGRQLLFLTMINFLARMSMRPIWWIFKQ